MMAGGGRRAAPASDGSDEEWKGEGSSSPMLYRESQTGVRRV